MSHHPTGDEENMGEREGEVEGGCKEQQTLRKAEEVGVGVCL